MVKGIRFWLMDFIYSAIIGSKKESYPFPSLARTSFIKRNRW